MSGETCVCPHCGAEVVGSHDVPDYNDQHEGGYRVVAFRCGSIKRMDHFAQSDACKIVERDNLNEQLTRERDEARQQLTTEQAAHEVTRRELAEAKATIELFEGMKEGVAIRIEDLERRLEACRRYFEHGSRITLPTGPVGDTPLMGVRMALKQEAKEACRL